MARFDDLNFCLEAMETGLSGTVQSAKILVVGAGGIGCELLKNLVMSGFVDIEIIDLDTIDVSNLNRQFLFRREHVGQSKAEVARQAALAFNPAAKIVSRHGNIKDGQFDAEYFRQFTLVMNALDNLEARRHVNRMCLSTKRPLIESGTQGYLGQVTCIQGGKTECFECQVHPTPKTFAYCTIRNTPDKPVHCIVWAKELFAALMGDQDEAMLADMTVPLEADDGTPFSHRLWEKCFVDDITKQQGVASRWEKRKPPQTLPLASLLSSSAPTSESSGLVHMEVPTMANAAQKFVDTVDLLLTERKGSVGKMEFDKDDKLVMDMVETLANARMHAYHIPMISPFQAKGIAGNIVHAIATTNAICAGLIVMEAFKLLSGQEEQLRTTWIKRHGPRVLQPSALAPPNPNCFICGGNGIDLELDLTKFTVRDFYSSILKGHLAFNDPSLNCLTKIPKYIEEESDIPPDVFNGSVSDWGLTDGTIVNVDDFSQDLAVKLIIRHRSDLDEEKVPKGYLLHATQERKSSPAKAAAEVTSEVKTTTTIGDDGSRVIEMNEEDDDDLIMIVDDPPPSAAPTISVSGSLSATNLQKRAHDPAPAIESAPKRSKKA